MHTILTIDQSTSGTKAALMDERGQLIRVARRKHETFYPAPGQVEHDPEAIWQNVLSLLAEVTREVDPSSVAGLALSNQRETTVLWERSTGKPVHHAVVWQDVRAKALTDSMRSCGDQVREKTGLQLSPYYSAAKAAAVLREHPDLALRASRGELCMGTMDSYLLYRLTRGASFATDVSNASRTQLLSLANLQWDSELAEIFGLPMNLLPERVLPSDGAFGQVAAVDYLKGVPIAAMMGDSHASFYGHGCVTPGMVKTSYGTGSSIMMNLGERPILSRNGLSTSVGYSRGGKTCYVLEGNITSSADTLMWLRDDLQLIRDMGELEEAAGVSDTRGVYLVPAFSGLGAPFFNENARALLFGMNRGTRRAHVLRAALASIAHQNADVLDAMCRDAGQPISLLKADGGGSVNPLLMQMQSDYTPCRVFVTAEKEMTLLGVGLMAGRSLGLLPETDEQAPRAVYEPRMSQEDRLRERQGWQDALRRCS